MNIKHFVIVPFLTYQMNIKEDVLSDHMINYRLTYLTKNLISTLNNQTNLDFELILKVNPALKQEQWNRIHRAIEDATPKFKVTMIHDGIAIDDFFKDQWTKTEVVIISKIDDDDFIHKDAAQWAVNSVPEEHFDEIIVCGYKRTWKYVENSDYIGVEDYIPYDGHMGIFQSFIYDTTVLAYNQNLRGDIVCHDLIEKILSSERNYKCRIMNLDQKCDQPLAIYFRHRHADSYSRYNYNRTLQEDSQKLRETFIDKSKLFYFKEMFNFLPNNTSSIYSVAVVAIARNENLYINNWIDYHKKLGIDHFYIFDNSFDDEPRLDTAISQENKEITTIIPAYGIERYQTKAYKLAYDQFGSKHDYMMFLDIDEFFTLNWHSDVQEYIQFLKWQCPHFHTAKINWEIYDDNNVIERDTSVPPQEFFTHLSNTTVSVDHNSFCKSIVKTRIPFIEFPNPHFVISQKQYLVVVNSYGKPINMSVKTNYKYPEYLVPRDVRIAKIRHYPTMTIKEFIDKQCKPNYVADNTSAPRTLDVKFYLYCNRTEEKQQYHKEVTERRVTVSLTSYPHRLAHPDFINCLDSLVNQETDVNYKIVLTLYKNDIGTIPENVKRYIKRHGIEIIQSDVDIKQHKKYFYAMQKYKDYPLITVDDDMIYPKYFIESLYTTHMKNYNKVICVRYTEVKRDESFQVVPPYTYWAYGDGDRESYMGDIFGVGSGGILYPAQICKSITPKMIDLAYCVKSDDFLMYLISTSIGFGYMTANRKMFLETLPYGNDEQALWVINKKKDYKTQYIKYIGKFHSIAELMNGIVGSDVIISLTTYHDRMSNDEIYKSIDSLVNQKCDGIRYSVVMTLYRGDYDRMSAKMSDYIKRNGIEIIVVDEDLRPHNKYFYVMQKYKDVPIILADDDQIYRDDMVKCLYEDHLENPNTIICGRARKIKRDENGKTMKYMFWTLCGDTQPSMDIFPTGVGGVLYPPKFSQYIDGDVKKRVGELDVITNDDLFLHLVAKENSIPAKTVDCNPPVDINYGFGTPIQSIQNSKQALYKVNIGGGRNDRFVYLFDEK